MEYGTLTTLKKKFKTYIENDTIICGKYPQHLVECLVIIMDTVILKCIDYIDKNTAGLYVVKEQFLRNILNEYDFFGKYNEKFDRIINYSENLFFNSELFYNSVEEKYGNKMMIEKQAKNFLNFMIASLQYDVVLLSCKILNYINKKTLNAELLLLSFDYIMGGNYFLPQFKLKFDCCKNTDEKSENCGVETIDEESA
jgi:hypothetical protein